MKRLITTILIACLTSLAWCKEYTVYGPQGGLDMTITLPNNFNTATDSCPMVILMHGIFASKDITPMPTIAKELAKKGIASIRFTFGGHWTSEGEMVKMTIAKELEDAQAMWTYAEQLPYITQIGLLGHSQGGVIASMTAGILTQKETHKKPSALALLAPASILKDACLSGHILGTKFDPINPPEYIRCFGSMKLGKEYIRYAQQMEVFATAQAYKGPVQIIHGSNDKIVPLSCSQDFKNTYGNQAQMTIIPNENHRLSKHTKHIAQLVTTFFLQQLQ